MYYYKYSLTEINKKLSICTIEVIFGYVRSDPKINFSFGSPSNLKFYVNFKYLRIDCYESNLIKHQGSYKLIDIQNLLPHISEHLIFT